ncbi:AAA family ATPase [Actinomadura barringtoniae]|uniref:AAA family ATPase n=2 Tax=Actinomadura barringtoniae TaxID=1427535 RepID=A0A939PIL4_9ACTN|nr:AAA family ATPase [Actinomadura barringtoniae]
MSGVGKSTALKELARRGYRVVDTDDGDWIIDHEEPLLDEDRMDFLITEYEGSDESLFISGAVINQVDFYDRFDEIVLLSAPIDVMLERIAARDDNPFGKAPGERERIIDDTAYIEPQLREAATVEIDTRKPLTAVVDQIEALITS